MLITVIIPNYNHEKYLEKRILSVLNQTYKHDYEIIILDDCSTDKSKEIIEKFRSNIRVKKIIYNDKNSGSTFHQWNNAIFNYSNGKYIWIAESDDMAEPEFLEKNYKILSQDSDIVLSYSQSSRMNSEDTITGSWIDTTEEFEGSEIFENDFIKNGKEFVEKFLIHKNIIPNASGVVFKKDAYIQIKGANPQLTFNGDWDVWIKILMLGKVSYISEELNRFRFHEKSVIASAVNEKTNYFKRKRNLLEKRYSHRVSISKYFKENNYNELYHLNKKYLRKEALKFKLLSLLLFCR